MTLKAPTHIVSQLPTYIPSLFQPYLPLTMPGNTKTHLPNLPNPVHESGDDQPLHLSVMKPVEDAPSVVAVASPPRKSRMVPGIATRFGVAPATILPKTRKRASVTRFAI